MIGSCVSSDYLSMFQKNKEILGIWKINKKFCNFYFNVISVSLNVFECLESIKLSSIGCQ